MKLENLKSTLFQAFKIFFLFTFILGVLYPLSVTLISQVLFYEKSNGSLIKLRGQIVGSSLIAQNFTSPHYFWGRPSASSFGAVPSGASNLGPISEVLKNAIADRKSKGAIEDLLFASGSGLDPHISLKAALSQVPRIVLSRQLSETEQEMLRKRVHSFLETRDFGFLGEERINVLKLNLSLDQDFKF